jgi:hypothetical protein
MTVKKGRHDMGTTIGVLTMVAIVLLVVSVAANVVLLMAMNVQRNSLWSAENTLSKSNLDRDSYYNLWRNEKVLFERARDSAADAEHTITILSDQLAELQDKFAHLKNVKFDPTTATNVQILAQALATEAGPKATYEECRAIAQVMFNRFYVIGRETTTILDIVTEPGQFTAVSDGRWVWADPTETEMAAAYNCWNMIDADPFDDERISVADDRVLYFCATGHEDEFFKTKLVLVTRIGDTSFYQKRLEVK